MSPEEYAALQKMEAELEAEWFVDELADEHPRAASTELHAAEQESKRRSTMGEMVGSIGSIAMKPVNGVVAAGHGTETAVRKGASAVRRSLVPKFGWKSSDTPKTFDTSNFVLASMQEFAESAALNDGEPTQSNKRESDLVRLEKENESGPHAPRASRQALLELDWCLSSQTLELLCLAVLKSTSKQGRGHQVLRRTLDGCIPLLVPDSRLAVYQTRVLVSIARFLVNETDRDLVLGNTKLAINLCKLCEYVAEKMYCGWLVAGHEDFLRFIVHVISMVQDHSVYQNIYNGAAAASWKAALYVLSLGKGPALLKVLNYMLECHKILFNPAGMDSVMCCQVFNCLTDVLLMQGSAHNQNSTLLKPAATLVGLLLSVNSPHTRQTIMSTILVYKPSSMSFFRKGEKDKAIDIMKNGFDKLCGSDSISTFNPLRKAWNPGDQFDDFREWATQPATHLAITTRIAQALEPLTKDFHQRCLRLNQQDQCPFAVRSGKDKATTKRTDASSRQLRAATRKRSAGYEAEAESHRQEMRVEKQRRAMRQIKAQFGWLVSRRLFTRLWRPHDHWNTIRTALPSAPPQQKAHEMIDCFLDALHTRRRRIPMTIIAEHGAPQISLLIRSGSKQWLALPTLPGLQTGSAVPLTNMLAGVKINRDWNDATSDDEEDAEVRSPRINKSQSHGPMQQHTPDAVKETGEEVSAKVKVSKSSHALGSKLAPQQEDHAVSPAAKKSIFGVFGRSRKTSEKENPTSQSPGPPGGTGEGANSDSKLSNDEAGESAIQAPQAAPHETEGTDFPEHERTDDTEEDCDLQRRGSSASSAGGISTPGNGAAGRIVDEYGVSAFVDDSHVVTRMLKASRVEGLDCIAGTLAVCRNTKAMDQGDRSVKAVYWIHEEALHAMQAGWKDNDLIKLATTAGHDMSFSHINQVAPGVLKWSDDKTTSVTRRSWLQQPLALEFYDVRGASTLIVLPDAQARNDVISDLTSSGTLASDARWLMEGLGVESGGNSDAEKWLGVTSCPGWHLDTRKRESDARKALVKKWTSGLISNFEFLMELNLLAGRSTNDLSRYPVLPWVLADYTSETLDLNDPATFRDLSKPMGCQNAERQMAFEERYNEWDHDDNQNPPFHYGTHYSTSAHVLHFLVRVQPFTSMHIALQSGRFDQPDRLFHDIGESWKATAGNENMTEVKELVPEMYYLPEAFLNMGGHDMGQRDDGQRVDNVLLPPWAHGDASEFVRLHRAALESVYVSANLHKWIDLIFGYKQRGKYAVEAVNVFHYLTYEGAVDVASIKDHDEMQYQAVVSQISHFGQCPKQMFHRPHQVQTRAHTPGYSAICNPELLKPLDVNVHMLVGDVLIREEKVLAIGFGSALLKPTGDICLIPDSKHPGSVSVVVTETRKTMGLMQGLHQGLVTVIAVASDSSIVATGGQDGVVRLWDTARTEWWLLPPRPSGKDADALIGHQAPVTALALSKSQGVAVSGADDGSCILWDIARCTCLHVLEGHKEKLVGVAIDDENGSIITCSSSHMQAWSINGELWASLNRHDCQAFKFEVQCCAARLGTIWTVDTIFVSGHSDGHITFWKLIPMQRALRERVIPRDISTSASSNSNCPRVLAPMWMLAGAGEAVTVLRFSSDCRELVSGHERGKCTVWRISEDGPITLGLKWKEAGSEKPPTGGSEIRNELLAAALQKKVEFKKEEWEKFQVANLSSECYIKAGTRYFKPAGTIMQEVHELMHQDALLVAFAVGLAEPAGLGWKRDKLKERCTEADLWHDPNRWVCDMAGGSASRSKCLTKQAALQVLRAAVNPCVPYSEGEGCSGVYLALGVQGYLQRAVLALKNVDASGELVKEWQDWLEHFSGPWPLFWKHAEAFLASRIPGLSEKWLLEAQVKVADENVTLIKEANKTNPGTYSKEELDAAEKKLYSLKAYPELDAAEQKLLSLKTQKLFSMQ